LIVEAPRIHFDQVVHIPEPDLCTSNVMCVPVRCMCGKSLKTVIGELIVHSPVFVTLLP